MSTRYTLRLDEAGGKEVFKRWTGDREEMLRDLTATLLDLNIQAQRKLRFAVEAKDLMTGPMPEGVSQRGTSVLCEDWQSTLTFEVRTTVKE